MECRGVALFWLGEREGFEGPTPGPEVGRVAVSEGSWLIMDAIDV